MDDEKIEHALGIDVPLPAGGAKVPFGEITAEQAAEQGRQLAALAGFGPTQRVRPVARAWGELARELESAGAANVRALAPESVLTWAERLWILPPPDSFAAGSPPD